MDGVLHGKPTWYTSLCSVDLCKGLAELKATFASGKKHELTVSTYQMVILLLFNDRNELSYKEIKEATAIPVTDLRRSLAALACSPKHKILNKQPDGKTVNEQDVFSFNAKFKSKLHKLKIMAVVQKETDSERKETREKVDEDRKHQYIHIHFIF